MTLQQELLQRKLPPVLPLSLPYGDNWPQRKSEIKQLLQHEFAGFAPTFSLQNDSVAISSEKAAFGGKATVTRLAIRFRSPFAYASFPCTLAVPNGCTGAVPIFVVLSFTPNIADGLGEEILDSGFAIANIYYQDIAPDKDDNFDNGLGRFCKRNPYDSWGKIAMWAYGASRAADYLLTLPQLDASRFAIIGHSRLGKAALWCGAQDDRFSLVASVQSGAGGAAIFRGKTGERIADLAKAGSRTWLCQNFFDYINNESSLPFDQHFLLSLIAPRYLYVASATEDYWSDPRSELLAAMATSPVYETLGVQGLCLSGEALPDTPYHEGHIGYHLRSGTHYFSRDDWRHIINYRRLHGC